MHLILAALGSLSLAILVEANVGCPRGAEQIAAALAPLAPAGGGDAGPAPAPLPQARLRREAGHLWLTLEDRRQVRALPDAVDCARIARDAAVVLAAWQAELAEPEADSSPGALDSRAVVKPPEAGPQATPALPAAPFVREAAVLLVRASSDGLGGGLQLDATFQHLFLALTVETPSAVDLAPGRLHLDRQTLAAGFAWRWGKTGPSLELRGLVLAGLNEIWGSGYTFDESGAELGAGVTGGVRLSIGLGRHWSWLLDFAAQGWLLSPSAQVRGLPGSVLFSPLQVLLGSGMAFGDPG